jgi:predicted DNA-binding WGR domain protein
MTLIHRRDPARNMARFYALAVQADLLAGWSLVREWGTDRAAGSREGGSACRAGDCRDGALKLEARKRRRGYG